MRTTKFALECRLTYEFGSGKVAGKIIIFDFAE